MAANILKKLINTFELVFRLQWVFRFLTFIFNMFSVIDDVIVITKSNDKESVFRHFVMTGLLYAGVCYTSEKFAANA